MAIHYSFDFSKYALLTGTMSLFLVVSLFLQGCHKMKTAKERKIAVMTEADSMPTVAIPPIDSSAPLKTETATFALG